jgi:hypothetical protein
MKLGAKPLKWWELKGAIQNWGQGIVGEDGGIDLSWLSWAFQLQIESEGSCMGLFVPKLKAKKL